MTIHPFALSLSTWPRAALRQAQRELLRCET